MLVILAIKSLYKPGLNLTVQMKKLLILFLGLSIFAKSEYSFSQKIENPEFQSDKEIYLEALESLDSWNYYIRNNLDSLKLDAFRILLLGVEKNNEFAINVGKRSLGSYLIRTEIGRAHV